MTKEELMCGIMHIVMSDEFQSIWVKSLLRIMELLLWKFPWMTQGNHMKS